MTLICLIQRASILAGITFAGLSVYGTPAHAEPEYCIIASNGKTVCGKGKEIERMCVTTDGTNTICGKFKSFKPAGQEQEQGQEARTPAPISGYRKEVDNFVLTLESCKRVDESVKCQLKILNKGKKRNIDFVAYNSSLVEISGKSYPGSFTDFGSGSTASVFTEMDSKTEIIISITFPQIPDKVVKAQLLNLAFAPPIKPIQFRNIPISN